MEKVSRPGQTGAVVGFKTYLKEPKVGGRGKERKSVKLAS